MSTVSNAAEFFAAACLETSAVSIPGGNVVQVCELSLADRDEFVRRSKLSTASAAAWVISRCCVDASGVRLFTDSSEETLEAISAKSPKTLDAITLAIMRLSGLGAAEDPGKA